MLNKVKYTIEKHHKLGKSVNGNYVLWKEVISERGYGIKGIFQGTKQECKEKLKEIKGE